MFVMNDSAANRACRSTEVTKRLALEANQLLTDELSASLYTDTKVPLAWGPRPAAPDGGGRPRLVLLSDTHGTHRQVLPYPVWPPCRARAPWLPAQNSNLAGAAARSHRLYRSRACRTVTF